MPGHNNTKQSTHTLGAVTRRVPAEPKTAAVLIQFFDWQHGPRTNLSYLSLFDHFLYNTEGRTGNYGNKRWPMIEKRCNKI